MNKTYFATGSRKSATAKVWLVPGGADTVVNGQPLDKYFGRADLVTAAMSPLKTTGVAGFGLKCECSGGGLSAARPEPDRVYQPRERLLLGLPGLLQAPAG